MISLSEETQVAPTPFIVHEEDVRKALPSLDIRGALDDMFAALGEDEAVQPPQTLTLFPRGAGDFITYLGVLAKHEVFGAKLSPYVAQPGAPIVTAWTALMSMRTGAPLMWCDSALLTTERTAGTTALAVDRLARASSERLAIIGSGSVALAHLRHVAPLREWSEIRIHSPRLASERARADAMKALDARVRIAESVEECVRDADVVMLCTSSGTPVLPRDVLTKPALITSISTNAINAHEIDPAWLPELDVYCDYRASTPASAGEMKLAAQHGWSPESVNGDLPSLLAGTCAKPAYERHAFFRSIGLGLEDVAIASELYRHLTGRPHQAQ